LKFTKTKQKMISNDKGFIYQVLADKNQRKSATTFYFCLWYLPNNGFL